MFATTGKSKANCIFLFLFCVFLLDLLFTFIAIFSCETSFTVTFGEILSAAPLFPTLF